MSNGMKLIDLYNERAVNRVSQFAAYTKQIDIDTLRAGYHNLVQVAPRRHERGKSYFVGHTGSTKSKPGSKRREEHLALAIYNASRENRLLPALPDGRLLTILDYQTPLKAQRDDRGVGKVDLIGVIDADLLCVIELKIHGSRNALSDTPLRAMLEGFAYCAIIEANSSDIADEARLSLSAPRPALLVMAPEEYWMDYLGHPRAGNWYPAVRGLATGIADAMNMEVHLLVLRNAKFEMGLGRKQPRLEDTLSIVSVDELAT